VKPGVRQLLAIQLRIPPPCSQRPHGGSPTPGHVQCIHGSIQRLQLRRRAFHNSLFPGPHALSGPRSPPCNPSHAPSLLFARCLLRPRMLLWAGHVPRPPSPYLSLPPRLPAFPVRTGTATLTSRPSLFHLASAARRYHLLRSHPWWAQVCLPCPALPYLPASMSSLTPLDAYSCGVFPLSGVIPTPILAAAGLAPNTSCCYSIATAYKSDPTSTHRAPPAPLQSTRSHLVPFWPRDRLNYSQALGSNLGYFI
jgi:hypothetical protein